MKEKEVEKQLHILQREIAINGEELEALWRNQRGLGLRVAGCGMRLHRR